MRAITALPWAVTMTAIAAAVWFVHTQQQQTQRLDDEIQQLRAARAMDAQRVSAVSEQVSFTRQLALAAQPDLPTDHGHDDDPSTEAQHASDVRPEEGSEEGPEEGPLAQAGEEPRSTAAGSAPLELVEANIGAYFDSEEADMTAAYTADNIREQVTPLLSGSSSIETIDCRATMCRLESVQDDLETYRAFVARVTRSDACRECFYTQTGETEDERPVLTLYMARAGPPLPRIE